ncbi:MAG: hypothetical protein EU548_05955 [Promethearchaeota archaeon]|nr:MAG: hypothetical protein EU548_05955 [Candidatus Lokiarchaeota archaeon]
MPRSSGKRTLHFYNKSGDLDKVVEFLEKIQQKVNYINLTAQVEDSCRDIKVTLMGSRSRDLQNLAIGRIKDLARRIFELA